MATDPSPTIHAKMVPPAPPPPLARPLPPEVEPHPTLVEAIRAASYRRMIGRLTAGLEFNQALEMFTEWQSDRSPKQRRAVGRALSLPTEPTETTSECLAAARVITEQYTQAHMKWHRGVIAGLEFSEALEVFTEWQRYLSPEQQQVVVSATRSEPAG